MKLRFPILLDLDIPLEIEELLLHIDHGSVEVSERVMHARVVGHFRNRGELLELGFEVLELIRVNRRELPGAVHVGRLGRCVLRFGEVAEKR